MSESVRNWSAQKPRPPVPTGPVPPLDGAEVEFAPVDQGSQELEQYQHFGPEPGGKTSGL